MANSIPQINVADEMSKSFLDYSMSVIISRALPDVRDGLKPSQRRLLYAMHHDLSLSSGKSHLKCARIVGETMGKYHPHGDGAIYPTLVNMAQPWSMRSTLVDGQGNFGSVEGDPPAAMRYTEARLTHLGSAIMADLEKGTVGYVTTYDENSKEPSVLPAAFPNLLVNGGTGIAVGMATNIPPHNLGEIINGLCAQIDNPGISPGELRQHIKGPDFPTGCSIYGLKGVEDYFRTGQGSIKIRGVIEIEETDLGRAKLVIREIPYRVNRATLQERIAELVNEKILKNISGMRDLSDEETRIEIELKREAHPQVVVNQLYKLTSLETTFSSNMLAIHGGRPKLLSVKDALDCYIEHRREVIVKRTQFLLKKSKEKAEVLEAYLIALGHLDEFIRLVRDSKNREEAKEKLKAYTFPIETVKQLGILIRNQVNIANGEYHFSDRQVASILELRLYQLTALEQNKVQEDYTELISEIQDFLDILAKESRVLTIVKDELLEIKEKHATPRKTQILPDQGNISIEDLIPNEGMVVTLSHRGYIKRTIEAEYRVQSRGGKGVRGMETRRARVADEEQDFVEHLFSAQTHDYLMFFTNTGRVYVERVYEIPEGSRSSRGRNIRNILHLKAEEKIVAFLSLERLLDDEKQDISFSPERGYVFFATKNGKVKKTELSNFKNHRRDGVIAILLEENNELIDVHLTSGQDEVILVTNRGISLKFKESQARPMGRNTRGVKGIRPKEGDFVVSLAIVEPDATLLVCSSNGLGKRTDFKEYRLQGRGGKGIITMRCNEKTGKVVRAVSVKEEHELMLMTSAGQSIRIQTAKIRQTGRNAQGVKLVSLKPKEILRDIAVVISDSENELEEDSLEKIEESTY